MAYDAAAGELRPFQEVMFRRRKYGISEAVRDVPVSLFCFDLLYADGEDLTRSPYPRAPGAARRGAHPVRPDPADHGRRGEHPAGARRDVRAGDRRWLRGADLQVDRARLRLPGRQPRLAVDQVEAGLPQRAVRHRRSRRGRRVRRARPPPRRVRGGPAGGVRPGRRPVPHRRQVRHRVLRRRTGRAARTGWRRTGWTTSRRWSTHGSRPTSGSSPGSCSRCSAPSSRSRPTPPPGWGQLDKDSGLAMRFPRFTGRWRDDKTPQDATTTTELVQLYRQARHQA